MEDLKNVAGIDPDGAYWQLLKDKNVNVCIQKTYNYFNREKTDDVIIGRSFGSEDGDVTEFPDDKERDDKILLDLEKLGIKGHKLSTFFQYVSNDNC